MDVHAEQHEPPPQCLLQVLRACAGDAEFARVVGADGIEVVFSCDVGDEKSNAVIKLTGTRIDRGAPVHINSFRLVMP